MKNETLHRGLFGLTWHPDHQLAELHYDDDLIEVGMENQSMFNVKELRAIRDLLNEAVEAHPQPHPPRPGDIIAVEDCLAVVVRCHSRLCDSHPERTVPPEALNRGRVLSVDDEPDETDVEGMPIECEDCGNVLYARDIVAFVP